MIWEDYKIEFKPDGHLRDIHIKDVDLKDWQSFIDFLQSTDAALDYYFEGVSADLPTSIDKTVLDQDHSHLLSIHLDGVNVNCHFSIPEKIELDIDPREVDNEARSKVVFRFMSTLGRSLNKKVILTPENAEEQPIFKYEPGMGIKYLALDKVV